jgi:hypothetical protein
MWKALEGKRIAGGKRIAKGELQASLRAKILRTLKREYGQCKSKDRELYT